MTDETKEFDATKEFKFGQLKKLREPIEPNLISLLPKPTKRENPKGKCNECGGYHGLPAVHLQYCGHAATTHRLLDADPEWTWEPFSVDSNGLPQIDKDGGLWIRLTICGVTRNGYGDAGGKTGCDAMKERIGDAIRNAAMRFGVALDLWHKGQLHADTEPPATDTALADKWLFEVRKAEDIIVLADVWAKAVIEITEHKDRYAYDEVKTAYKARRAELTPGSTGIAT